VKAVPWRWLGRRAATHVLPPGFIAGLITLVVLLSVRRWLFTYASLDACTADGTFSLNNTDYDPWAKDSVFAINMRLGSSSLAIANLIDVCWDIVSRDIGVAKTMILTGHSLNCSIQSLWATGSSNM
jgi:hypothetical protein